MDFGSSPARTLLVAVLGTLLLATPVAADAQSRTERARDRAERALERVERLADRRGVKTGREVTLALVELARQRTALSRTDQAAAARFFARPTDPTDMDAFTAPSVKSCTDHFCVHWVETGNDAPDLTDGPDQCVTPDYIDAMQAAFEHSFAVENGTLGWRAPLSDNARGGDPRTDVYVTDLNPPGAGAGLYGYANPEQSARVSPGYLVLDDDYAADEFDDYGGNPIPPMQVTAAHEYNHLLQFGYDLQQDLWMFESTATWSEEKVFPAVDDYLFYLPTFAALPHQPITAADSGRQYGSAVWNHYLDAKYGPEVVRDAWARSAANSVGSLGFAPKAYDMAIRAEGGPGFSPDFGDFTAATAEWRAANSGFPDASRYPDVRREAGQLALDAAAPTQVAGLDHTGYRLFRVPSSNAAALELTGTMPGNVAGSFALVGDDDGQMTRVVSQVAAGGSTTLELPDPGRFERITAVVTNTDYRQDGFDTATGDWNWEADDQTATVKVSTQASLTRSTSAAGPEPHTPTTRVAAVAAVTGESTVKACDPGVQPTPTPVATPTATATPTPPPPPPATSLTLSRSSTRTRTVARTGVLALFARTNKAGRLGARASVDRVTARRLRVGRRATTTGTGRRTATSAGRFKVNVRLSRKARAALQRQTRRTLRMKVRVTLLPVDGTSAVARTISLLLRP